jgi:hypothetical protein
MPTVHIRILVDAEDSVPVASGPNTIVAVERSLRAGS